MTRFTEWSDPFAEHLHQKFKDKKGALLPILHEIQDALGHIPPAAIRHICDSLNLSKAEVDGVISFYHDFKKEHDGRFSIKVCRAEACQSSGSEELISHIQKRLTQDGTDTEFHIEAVYCLGNCALSPSVMMKEKLYGRVTPNRFDHLLTQERTNHA
ncbi:NAD(P)H-dependent oxidoreductase subunit E [Terasakiella pusilla]|uniref:NAD(P)H-dependent oxidoreductase subunit E n=1 Tax=Terasakiella pusilla TaxID=64973 RepID=UPI003AA828B6